MVAANLCGNFTFPNNKPEFDQFLMAVGADIAGASQFLVEYIPKKLVSSTKVIANLILGI